MKTVKILAAVVLVIAGLAACSSTHQDAPDPVPGNVVNPSNIRVIQEPDGFRNVAVGCDGPNMVYVTSRGCDACTPTASSVYVVANDPRCSK